MYSGHVVHAEWIALCTQYPPLLLNLAESSLDNQNSFRDLSKTRSEAFPSPSLWTIPRSSAVHGSLKPLHCQMRRVIVKQGLSFWRTSRPDGTNSYSAGASTSEDGWRLLLLRIFSWLRRHNLLPLAAPQLLSRARRTLIKSFSSLVRLGKICSLWIIGIRYLLFRRLPSAWAASTQNWLVNSDNDWSWYCC